MLSTQAMGAQIRECLVALAVPALPEPPMVASLATEEEKVRAEAHAPMQRRAAVCCPSALQCSSHLWPCCFMGSGLASFSHGEGCEAPSAQCLGFRENLPDSNVGILACMHWCPAPC